MNILQIGELYSYGGASEIMELNSTELNKHGYKSVLVYGYNYTKAEVLPDHYVIFQNRILRGINNKLRFLVEKYNFSNFYARLFVEFLIRKHNIDVIHFHAMQGGFLSMRDIKYLIKKYKTVWTIHDTWPITGGCMCFWDCNKWVDKCCKGCESKDLQMRFKNSELNLRRKYESLTNKKITIITPSKWMADNVRKSYLGKEKTYIIFNGIDLSVFKPLYNLSHLKNKYGVNENKTILMFMAGSLKDPYKGFLYLKEALHKIKAPHRFEIILVGNETESIDDLAIPMHKMGYIKDKRVLNELYNISDLFLLPSVQDNFPTVSLESSAAGTPVIAFKTGGIPEQITEDTGWIVNEINSDAFANCINQIFELDNYKEILKRKGIMARERCEKLYNNKTMSSNYILLYSDLIISREDD